MRWIPGPTILAAGCAVLACGGHDGSSPQVQGQAQGPSITVDSSSCETNLETLYTSPAGTPEGLIESVAVGADGTVYFATMGDGIFALSGAGQAPQQIVPALSQQTTTTLVAVDDTTQLWVEGSTLLVGTDGVFDALPTSGGAPQLVGQLAPLASGSVWQTGRATMDATSFYVAAYEADDSGPSGSPGVWRVPRDGSAPQLLASSSLVAPTAWVPLLLDGDTLYTLGGTNIQQVVTLPTGGGSPAALAGALGDSFKPFAPLADQVFVSSTQGAVTRYPVDGSEPGTAIGGVDGPHGSALSMVSDAAGGAYVAFWSAPDADAQGNCSPPGCSIRMAIAALPSQDAQVSASACTPAFTLGSTGNETTSGYLSTQMTLDASYVYVLANVGVAAWGPQAILRAPRAAASP